MSFVSTGAEVRVVPPELGELPLLRGYSDEEALSAIADRFVQREFDTGDVIVEAGAPADQMFLIAHGRIDKIGAGKYGERTVLGVLADGDHFGDDVLLDSGDAWTFTAKAASHCVLLSLSRDDFRVLADATPELRAHLEQIQRAPRPAQNKHGEAAIAVASGHEGEPVLPGTFVDYEPAPREYELSVAQTVLRVHSRVADLYNQPMNQTEQQLRLTIEALRERQEFELVNNRDFGLLHNADFGQRIQTRGGPPTPDDLDELLSRRRKSRFLLAHPRAIAAFGRQCSSRGLSPESVDNAGHRVTAWRGVPIYPCDKIPVTADGVSSIFVLRTGVDDNGVIGLHQTGIPDEYEPGLSVRFMGIDDKALISYLVSTYYSAAVLVPDALGVLENVEVAR